MKQDINAGWKETINQMYDYYSPQVESLQDQILDLKRENRELRRLKDRSIWRIIKDKMIARLSE
jgi:hypothetical protein